MATFDEIYEKIKEYQTMTEKIVRRKIAID